MRRETYQYPQTGTAAHTLVTPSFIGQLYVKTDDNTQYCAYGTAVGEWNQIDSDPSNDVTTASNLGDNKLLRGNGGAHGIQDTGITVDDTTNNMSGVGTLGCGAITSSGTLALSANSITMTGSLAATGARVTKGWFTDIEITNSPTVNGTAISAIYAPIASPTFTGTVTIPTPFTLGAVSVTTTGTILNYLTSATGTTGTNTTNIVFSTSPTLVTPVLGVASATSLRIANDNWLSGVDYAGTSYVNMFKVNASDEIDCGGTLNISGYIEGPTDGGAITLVDMPVTSSAADDTEESYTMKIDGVNMLKIYSLSDGAGSIDNKKIISYVDFETQAGIYQNTTDVAAATYDLLATDNVLLVSYTATGAVTSLTLPTAQCVDGRTITIKDSGGNAGANNITIDTEAGEKVDGQDTYVINNDYDSVTLISNGSNWFIL